jgi:hypothetical protein
VDPGAGLVDVERKKFLILPELELRSLSRPARSQSLCRLRYPGSLESEDDSWKVNSKVVAGLGRYHIVLGRISVPN